MQYFIPPSLFPTHRRNTTNAYHVPSPGCPAKDAGGDHPMIFISSSGAASVVTFPNTVKLQKRLMPSGFNNVKVPERLVCNCFSPVRQHAATEAGPHHGASVLPNGADVITGDRTGQPFSVAFASRLLSINCPLSFAVGPTTPTPARDLPS